MLVFFLILLIAFAYVWRMGALDWVRSTTTELRRHRERKMEAATVGRQVDRFGALHVEPDFGTAVIPKTQPAISKTVAADAANRPD